MLDRAKGKQYRFHCGQWLALDEGDGKLSRTLKVVGGSGRGERERPSEIGKFHITSSQFFLKMYNETLVRVYSNLFLQCNGPFLLC